MKRTLIELAMLVVLAAVSWPFLSGKTAILLNNKGVEQYNRGELEQALRSFELSLRLKPQANVLCNLANTFRAQGMRDAAISKYKEALRLDAYCTEAHFGLAYIYEEMGDYQKSQACLEQAESLGAQKAKEDLDNLAYAQLVLLYNQAADYYESGDNHNTELKLNEVIRLDPGFALAYKTLGDIKFGRNQIPEAIDDYKRGIAAGLDDASFYNLYNDIGIAYMRLEQYAEALKYLRKAYGLDAGNMEILYSLASTLRDNGNSQQALEKYKELIAVNSIYPNAHNDIGDIYKTQDRKEEAQKEYRAEIDAVLTQPENTDSLSQNRLAIAYTGLGEYERAKNMIDKALRSDPRYAEAYYTRARIYEYLGEEERAMRDLEKAKRLFSSKLFLDNSIMRLEIKEPVSKEIGSFSEELVICLKNGRQIQGRLKRKEQDAITLDVLVGDSWGTITIQLRDIRSMQSVR